MAVCSAPEKATLSNTRSSIAQSVVVVPPVIARGVPAVVLPFIVPVVVVPSTSMLLAGDAPLITALIACHAASDAVAVIVPEAAPRPITLLAELAGVRPLPDAPACLIHMPLPVPLARFATTETDTFPVAGVTFDTPIMVMVLAFGQTAGNEPSADSVSGGWFPAVFWTTLSAPGHWSYQMLTKPVVAVRNVVRLDMSSAPVLSTPISSVALSLARRTRMAFLVAIAAAALAARKA